MDRSCSYSRDLDVVRSKLENKYKNDNKSEFWGTFLAKIYAVLSHIIGLFDLRIFGEQSQ